MIDLAKLIEDYNNRLTNDARHDKSIKSLENKINKISRTVSNINKEERKEVNYHGFPKYLQTELELSLTKKSKRIDRDALTNAIVGEDDIGQEKGFINFQQMMNKKESVQNTADQRRHKAFL